LDLESLLVKTEYLRISSISIGNELAALIEAINIEITLLLDLKELRERGGRPDIDGSTASIRDAKG
jgi:hypothetical protein